MRARHAAPTMHATLSSTNRPDSSIILHDKVHTSSRTALYEAVQTAVCCVSRLHGSRSRHPAMVSKSSKHSAYLSRLQPAAASTAYALCC